MLVNIASYIYVSARCQVNLDLQLHFAQESASALPKQCWQMFCMHDIVYACGHAIAIEYYSVL